MFQLMSSPMGPGILLLPWHLGLSRNIPPLMVGLPAGTITLEISLVVPHKIRSTSKLDPAITILDIYPKDAPTYNKGTWSTMFITALFIISRSWKEPRCPLTEKWVQKMWYIYTMECYSAIKNNEFMKFLGKRMELESVILSEATQSQRSHMVCTH